MGIMHRRSDSVQRTAALIFRPDPPWDDDPPAGTPMEGGGR